METVPATEQVAKKPTYPTDEEETTYEKEIIDAIKKLDTAHRYRFVALNNVVLQKKQQDAELDAEMKTIVNKYNKLQEPITEASDAIISGTRALTEEELTKAKSFLSEEEQGKIGDANKTEAIPDYWPTAISNSPIESFVEEADKPILKHVTCIEHKPDTESENFTITFHFSPNEYFENESLTVKFFMLNENEPEKTEGTEIKWKEGKNITKKTVTKKQKNKKTGKTREIQKEVDAETFFNFFKTINVDLPEGDEEEADEEEANALMEILDNNFEIAQNIENELLPYHLEYFLGIREPDEDDDDYGDLDDEDDDDDDEEEDKPKGKKPKGKKKGSEDQGEGKQECKQQ